MKLSHNVGLTLGSNGLSWISAIFCFSHRMDGALAFCLLQYVIFHVGHLLSGAFYSACPYLGLLVPFTGGQPELSLDDRDTPNYIPICLLPELLVTLMIGRLDLNELCRLIEIGQAISA